MATASVVLVSAIVLGVAWAAPALAQPGVVFGVRVPGDHRDDPAITGERRRYRVLVAAVIAAVVVHKSDADTAPRPTPEAVETEVVARDDDRFWRGGLLYVNGDDPAVLVPKRFGIGWTVNFGNPKTVAGLFVLVAGIVVLVVATA